MLRFLPEFRAPDGVRQCALPHKNCSRHSHRFFGRRWPSLLAAMLLAASPAVAGVMMEGFYWNCPSPWYPTMQSEASALANMAGGYGKNRASGWHFSSRLAETHVR